MCTHNLTAELLLGVTLLGSYKPLGNNHCLHREDQFCKQGFWGLCALDVSHNILHMFVILTLYKAIIANAIRPITPK